MSDEHACGRPTDGRPQRAASTMPPISPNTRLALAVLATWRVTHLLVEEDGPADAVVRLRARAGNGQLGRLMDCFYCLSVWVALPFALALAPARRPSAVTWLALSGAACLLEQATRRSDPEPEVSPL